MNGKYLISDSERENCMAAIKEAVKHATLAYEFVSRTAGEPRGLFHRQLDHATGARTQGQTVMGKAAFAIWEAATPAIGTPTPKTQARIIRADLTISTVMIRALRSSRLAGGRR